METVKLTHETMGEALRKSKEVVLRDGVLVYPTDTVYGLGGNAHSAKVVERIRKIKGRETTAPFSVIMSDVRMIEEYCEVSFGQRAILNKYLPGPYTFLLKAKKSLPVTDNEKLGVRIPEVAYTHQLAEVCGVPIITTSANFRGELPPVSLSEVDGSVLEMADLVIDGGKTKHRGASAVVDLVERKIIRKGIGRISL